MKKFLLLSMLVLMVSFTSCTSEVDPVEQDNAELVIQVEQERSYTISEIVAEFEGTETEKQAYADHLLERQQRGGDEDCEVCSASRVVGVCTQWCWNGIYWHMYFCTCPIIE